MTTKSTTTKPTINQATITHVSITNSIITKSAVTKSTMTKSIVTKATVSKATTTKSTTTETIILLLRMKHVAPPGKCLDSAATRLDPFLFFLRQTARCHQTGNDLLNSALKHELWHRAKSEGESDASCLLTAWKGLQVLGYEAFYNNSKHLCHVKYLAMRISITTVNICVMSSTWLWGFL